MPLETAQEILPRSVGVSPTPLRGLDSRVQARHGQDCPCHRWLGQSCPSTARTRLSVLPSRRQDAQYDSILPSSVDGVDAIVPSNCRRLVDTTVRRHPAVVGEWRPRPRTVYCREPTRLGHGLVARAR
ncbi:MAG: hypothetical protein NZ874_06635 [Fimbriimonadales bacterium]|nr:hypothetical protein [Fimbriimonadales bacterium]